MKGAIVGDIISSIKTPNNLALNQTLNAGYLTFSDSTVMTLATAHALISDEDFLSTYRSWGLVYAHARRSAGFNYWLRNINDEEVVWRHGPALRISPIALTATTLEQAEALAEENARLTHQSDKSIRGAKAVSAAIFLAKVNTPKDNIEVYIEHEYGYRFAHAFTSGSAEHSIEKAIANFIFTESFEDGNGEVRN